ncbi:MAG: metallophosphoesterase [Finegoldia sp.]|nr:metallophosphoesterase [Finegoldia sp.]
MKFVQISDCHIMKEYGDRFLGIMKKLDSPAQKLEKVLKSINWQAYDFVVFNGDMIHDGDIEDYLLFKELVEKNIPKDLDILYVLGNHDKKEEFFEVFPKYKRFRKDEGFLYYSKDFDNYRLIVLDSADPDLHEGIVGQDQMNWLEEELKACKDLEPVIFLHHPIRFTYQKGLESELVNYKNLIDLLNNYQVKYVFAGHTHKNALAYDGRLVQVIGDSTSFSIDLNEKDFIRISNKVGYNRIDLNNDYISIEHENFGDENISARIEIKEFIDYLYKKNKQGGKKDE